MTPHTQITCHPPEHNTGTPTVVPAGCCCCCCCCCCLHTMGGIGGAVMGSAANIETHPVPNRDKKSRIPFRFDVFEEDQPLISPVLLYWLMVLLAILATIGITAASTVSNMAGGPGNSADALFNGVLIGLFLAVMCFPVLQVVASIFSYIVIGIFYPERSYALRRVTRITLYSLAGMGIGLLLMGGCFGLLYLGVR